MRTGLLLIFSILVLAFSPGQLAAQAKQKLKAAKHNMEILNYQGAIEEYNSILSKHDDIAEAQINLAECYRKVSDIDNAEYWYGQVVRLPEAEPEHYLFYGYMLQRNGKCDMAREWFEKFLEAKPDDSRGRHLLRACDYEKELESKNAGIYEIEHMPFNSGLDDFGPMYYGDGIVFASETHEGGISKRIHCWTGNQFLDLRYVDRNEEGEDSSGVCGSYTYTDPENFSNQLNTKFHDATPSFSEDQSTIYFTRNNLMKGRARKDDEGIIRLKIFSAEGGGEGGSTSFKNVEGLPFNSDEYSVAHPSLSPDGNFLYFASDMPGGFGGMDLYVSEQEDGRWGPPINLGPKVNTEGQEVFPYFSKNNDLYFSSDGHVGLGGLDVYQMEKKDGFNEWGDIINVGAPINSRDDDFGYIINEENNHGYFTSDREGGFGDDDIYSFCRNAAELEIYVYDEMTLEPIEGAEVVSDCTGNTVYTDEEGKATVIQRNNQCCTFSASKEEYEDNSKEGCTIPGENTLVEIPLKKPINCVVAGRVTTDGTPMQGMMVTATGNCGDEQATTTDADGRYEMNLVDPCEYTISVTPPSGYDGPGSTIIKTRNEAGEVNGDCQFNVDFPFRSAVPNPGDRPDGIPPNYVITGYDRNGNPIYGPPGGTTGPGSGGQYVDGKFVPTAPGVSNSWTLESIISEAQRNEPLECCDLIGNLQTGAGSIGASPSVAYTNPGEPIPYLLHIYYDFDQSYIRPDAEPELEKLLALLNENPTIKVEIGSHTDSRGSNSYNNRLSQRRSESVIRWLKDKGVSGGRLTAQGYGETMNINNCANNVPCSESEHQLNRRTEFRVVGLTDGTNFSTSTPRNSVDGVGCQGCPF